MFSIRRAAEFDAVFKRGKRLFSACFALCYLKTERDYPRLGMMISKKQCALAVRRNRIKRITREHFRLHQQELTGFDVVVWLRSSTKAISDQEQTECLKNLFAQLLTQCGGSVFN